MLYQFSLVRRHQPHANGVTDQAGQVANVQLLHELGPMCLDGLGTDAHAVGNLASVQALPQQLKHLQLAIGKTLNRRCRVLVGVADGAIQEQVAGVAPRCARP